MGYHDKYSKELEDQMVSLYTEGLDCVQIAKITGVKYNTSVRRVLIRKGVPLINSGDRQRYVQGNPFLDFSDEAVQYWLGYIASDGCISELKGKLNTVRLNTNKDPEMLENYCKFLGGSVKVTKTYNSSYNVYEYCVGFKSPKTAEYLNSLGITPRKSLTLKVNFELTWPFIRGYFEGNGCVSNWGINISTGSKEFAEQIEEFYKLYEIEHKLHTSTAKDNLYYIIYLKGSTVEKWSSLVYPEGLSSLLYLPRKRDKVLNFV